MSRSCKKLQVGKKSMDVPESSNRNKKRKVANDEEFDGTRFLKPAAQKVYSDNINKRSILPEQYYACDEKALPQFWKGIRDRGWLELVTPPKETSCSHEITREFYANLIYSGDKTMHSWVRRVNVYFDANTINEFYGLQFRDDEVEEYGDPEEREKEITFPESSVMQGSVPHGELNDLAKAWSAFACTRLAPTTNKKEYKSGRLDILYRLTKGCKVNVGKYINEWIRGLAEGKDGNAKYPFPYLITGLCKRAGVDFSLIPMSDSIGTIIDTAKFCRKVCLDYTDSSGKSHRYKERGKKEQKDNDGEVELMLAMRQNQNFSYVAYDNTVKVGEMVLGDGFNSLHLASLPERIPMTAYMNMSREKGSWLACFREEMNRNAQWNSVAQENMMIINREIIGHRQGTVPLRILNEPDPNQTSPTPRDEDGETSTKMPTETKKEPVYTDYGLTPDNKAKKRKSSSRVDSPERGRRNLVSEGDSYKLLDADANWIFTSALQSNRDVATTVCGDPNESCLTISGEDIGMILSGRSLKSSKISSMVEEKAKAGTTEEVLKALMEFLLDPLLHSHKGSSSNPPSIDHQSSVARQMHAVVLLYNYYHRKLNPELEFLNYESFCKLAVSVRESLLSYMKLTNESNVMESNSSKVQLSVTEKAVKNACNIALSLDASAEYPDIKGWPIHKVAVLLIDISGENCLMQFGEITQGVWSVFEEDGKFLEEKTNGSNKRKISSLKASTDDNEILKLVYDVVKDVEDVDTSNIVILETHVAYSLSKEKSATQFIMVQTGQTFKDTDQSPLKPLVESLQGTSSKISIGPVVEYSYNSWSITKVAEHYNVLPYADFISRWFLKKDLCSPNGQITTQGNCLKELSQSKMPNLPLSGEELDRTYEDDVVQEKSNKIRNTSNDTKMDAPNKVKTSDTKGDGIPSKMSEKTVILENAAEGTTKKPNSKVSRNSMSTAQQGPNENLNVEMVDSLKSKDTISKNEKVSSDTKGDGIPSEVSEKTTIIENSAEGTNKKANEYFKLNVEMVHSLNSKDTTRIKKDKVSSANNDDVTISCDQSSISRKGNILSKFEATTKCDAKVENVPVQEILDNASVLLYRKIHSMASQLCSLEDSFAQYVDNFIRVKYGGDVDLAQKYIDNIIRGNTNHLMPKQEQDKSFHGVDRSDAQSEKEFRLCGTYVHGKSSCHDLETICLKNEWIPPRYSIGSSNGKYFSSVIVRINDADELTLEGSLESKNPREARESAAAQMIAKIQSLCSVD